MEICEMLNSESSKKLMGEYPLTRNLTVDPRLLGVTTLLSSMTKFNSGQRTAMFSSNIVQALIPDGAEMPQVATGFERKFADYTFNTTRMKQGGTTICSIPKYRVNVGRSPINFNPSSILIYIGDEDGLIHYCDVNRYTKGQDGFGYANYINEALLRPGVGIPKGITLSHSKALQGSKYGFGINANITYMTMKETTEDAFCMSRSLANSMCSTGLRTLMISIDKNMVPLNLYGSADEYKIFPDLHETVRDDGIICAFRDVNESSMICDMTDTALMSVQHLHDEIYYAVEPGATVVDIDIYKNPNRQIKTPQHIFEQTDKYIENALFFHRRVLEVYEQECVRGGRTPAPEFRSLIQRSVEILGANKEKYLGLKNQPKFTYKGDPVKFIHLVITYKYENKVTRGYKITDESGAKGVLSDIWEDDDMPVTDDGIRADLVISPEATINRMNLGQLYEVFLNMVMHKVITEIQQIEDPITCYATVLNFIQDVNPEYAKIITDLHVDVKQRYQFIKQIKKERKMILVCPPFLETITIDWVDMMVKKYQISSTPVEYNLRDADGKLIRRVRTLRPIYIGKKYLIVLCKIPHARSSGMSYINQLQIPIRIKAKKYKSQYPIGLVPIRLGEDEKRNLHMTIGDMATRILAVYANSPDASRMLAEDLLTMQNPSKLDWINATDSQLSQGNNMIKVSKHLLATCGIDSDDIHLTIEEERELRNLVSEGETNVYQSSSDDL